MLEKVTAFIIRTFPTGKELLILQHPFAGYQLPAGTVNLNETPENAVVREVAEETGLKNATITAKLGYRDTLLPPDRAVLIHPTRVFSRPDPASFDWIDVNHGLWLDVLRQQDGYTQVRYREPNTLPDFNYYTYEFTGWVPDEFLSQTQRRYFYMLNFNGQTPVSWKVNSDWHTFTLSWAPLDDLPDLIPPQDTWLEVLFEFLRK